jgi:hypothetical protein
MTKFTEAGARPPAAAIRQRPGLRIALLSLASLIVACGAVAVVGYAYAAHDGHPAVTRPAVTTSP